MYTVLLNIDIFSIGALSSSQMRAGSHWTHKTDMIWQLWWVWRCCAECFAAGNIIDKEHRTHVLRVGFMHLLWSLFLTSVNCKAHFAALSQWLHVPPGTKKANAFQLRVVIKPSNGISMSPGIRFSSHLPCTLCWVTPANLIVTAHNDVPSWMSSTIWAT